MDEITVSRLTIDIGASSDDAKRKIDGVAKSLSKLRGTTNQKIKVDAKDVDKAHKKVGALTNILNSLKRIAFYRVIRSAIKAVGDAMREGEDNAYWYAKSVGDSTKYIADAYDSLAGKGFTMENQLGAAWATLKATITPILIEIVRLVTMAAQAITQLFAILGGKGTYLKAIDYTKQWADTTAKGAGSAKEWKNQLMGFDEINRLEEPSSGGGGGGGGLPDYENMFEEANVDGLFAKIAAKFKELKESIDFAPIQESIKKLKDSLSGLWNTIEKGLGWAWDHIFVTLAHWAIEEAAPATVNLLAEAFDFLRASLEFVAPAFEWLWDHILSPLAEWTGDLFISALKTIADLFHDLTDLLDGNMTFKEFVEQLTPLQTILVEVATAIIAVKSAMSIFNTVSAIASLAAGGFAKAIAFLTSPIGIAIVAIGALVGAGILLYKHWDEISAWLAKTWETICAKATEYFGRLFNDIKVIWANIKTVFQGLVDFVAGIFTGDWSRAWNGISSIVSGAIGAIISSIAGVYDWFRGLIQACADAISWLRGVWDGINQVANRNASNIQANGSIYLTGFASGGYPENGQLFLAREAGPELVGTMGGRTAVANNDQIVDGIREGVFEAVTAAMGGNGGNGTPVYIYLDGREIASSTTKYQRQMARANG